MILFAYAAEIATFLLLTFTATQLPQFGAMLVLANFAIVGLLFLLRTPMFLDVATRWWWLLLTPMLAAMSGLWSDLPVVSTRYGVQFLYTCFVGVLLARLLTPRRFILTLMVAFFVFCLLCVLSRRMGSSAEGMVLIGLTGSKNQMGYAAQVLMLASLAVLLMRNVAMPLRWIALLALPLSVYLVAGTNATTAVLLALGGSALLAALWFAQRLPPGGRLATVLMLALVAAPLTALTPELLDAISRFTSETLHKDPTLTGRTLLWERADALIAQRPLLGYGFQSVWLGDSSESIGLRRLANIDDGRQFHFHHTFRQISVDTGLLGLSTFVLTMLAVAYGHLRQVMLRADVEVSFFFVLFALMLARAFTDLIVGPFSAHTLLFFACGVYAFWRPEAAGEVQPQAAAPVRLKGPLGALRR